MYCTLVQFFKNVSECQSTAIKTLQLGDYRNIFSVKHILRFCDRLDASSSTWLPLDGAVFHITSSFLLRTCPSMWFGFLLIYEVKYLMLHTLRLNFFSSVTESITRRSFSEKYLFTWLTTLMMILPFKISLSLNLPFLTGLTCAVGEIIIWALPEFVHFFCNWDWMSTKNH